MPAKVESKGEICNISLPKFSVPKFNDSSGKKNCLYQSFDGRFALTECLMAVFNLFNECSCTVLFKMFVITVQGCTKVFIDRSALTFTVPKLVTKTVAVKWRSLYYRLPRWVLCTKASEDSSGLQFSAPSFVNDSHKLPVLSFKQCWSQSTGKGLWEPGTHC